MTHQADGEREERLEAEQKDRQDEAAAPEESPDPAELTPDEAGHAQP